MKAQKLLQDWIRSVARVLMLLMMAVTGCDLSAIDGASIGFVGRDQGVQGCVDVDEDGHCASEDDCDDSNPLSFPFAFEYCDFEDNDCDGRIDEGLGVGEPCEPSELPGCESTGAVSCLDYEAICISSLQHVEDVCNQLDDDCDGNVDESDPSVGAMCDALGQIGHCARGSVVCSSGALVCGPADPAPEVCDAFDNDCDGDVDEAEGGVPLQVACRPDVPLEGVCDPGTFFCTGEEGALWGACIGYVGPQVEICDSVDNDCDGEVDELAGGCECLNGETEDNCYTGPPGTLGVGECASGPTRGCVYNSMVDSWEWGTCEDVPPSIEACDGLDNDCDGATDEGLALGDACTVGQGVCAVDGQVACIAGVAACNAVANAPQGESCNGLDDDCDGRVDETDAAACSTGVGECERNGVSICDAVSGQVICGVQPGPPNPETCDGLDNDCDGAIDESLNVGEPCSSGVGACERNGTIECSAGNEAVCSANPGDPTNEVCDELDNDCDGDTDEGLGLGNACDGIGECGPGALECALDNTVRCSTDVGGSADQAMAESCDGLDNDCDNEIDEVWQLGALCYGACGDGVFECNEAGFARCSTDLGGSDHAPVAETCNNIDDDCDGFSDEDFNLFAGCGLGQCAGGSNECDPVGGVRCSTGPGGSNDLSAMEVCGNGIDEDCDGNSDEGC